MKINIFIFSVSTLFFLQGCIKNQQKEDPFEAKMPVQTETLKEIPKSIKLPPSLEKDLSDWKEYWDFEKGLQDLLDSEGLNEMAVKMDDLVEKEKVLSQTPYHQKFDDPRVKSRVLVLKTRLYEFKTLLDEGLHSDTSAHNNKYILAEAFNALRNQFIEIEQGGLDKNILLKK